MKRAAQYVAVALVAGCLTSVAQPAHALVCTEVQELINDRKKFIRDLVRAERASLEDDSLTRAERREIRKGIRELRTRRHLLRVADRRIDRSNGTSIECLRIEAFVTRVASFA